MTDWTAVVPLKLNAMSKSRLSDHLPATSRQHLIEAMAQHVCAVLAAVPRIEKIVLLSDRRPDWWAGVWVDDKAAGLNASLQGWREAHGGGAALVVHGDLPYLAADDIEALLDAAEAAGMALASDTAGEGTNALAIANARALQFAFGPGSRALHSADPATRRIDRPGLARDIDSRGDLEGLIASGFFERRWTPPELLDRADHGTDFIGFPDLGLDAQNAGRG